MSQRMLRSGTRRDYKKMDEGQGDEILHDEMEKDTEVESDIVASEKELVIGENTETSSDEEEMIELERRFREANVQKEKLERKEKLKRLKKELKAVEGRVKRRKKTPNEEPKGQVTINSVRSMKDVEKKVNKLMEKNLGCFGKGKGKGEKKSKGKSRMKRYELSSSESESSSCQNSDSDSDSSCSSTCSSSSSCSDQWYSYRDHRKKKDRKNSKSKSRKSGKNINRRSGKNRKISSNVKYPQQWPQSQLSLHFVNKDKKYDDLTIEEFCAGYATILENTRSKSESKYRITHLKDLMYLATKYRWDCVLNFHAACLLEIERGHIGWGDSFQSLQITTLAGGFIQTGQQRSSKGHDGPVVFCKNFQRGLCPEDSDHPGELNGSQRLLRHICAKCWLLHRKKASHAENDEECPSKEV